MTSQSRPRRHDLLLWTALIAPAVAWFAQLTTNYTIAAYACASDQIWIFHTISLAALVLAGAGVYSGWRVRRRQGDYEGRESDFLTSGTLLLAGLFLLAILWNEASNWLLEPCV